MVCGCPSAANLLDWLGRAFPTSAATRQGPGHLHPGNVDHRLAVSVIFPRAGRYVEVLTCFPRIEVSNSHAAADGSILQRAW